VKIEAGLFGAKNLIFKENFKKPFNALILLTTSQIFLDLF